MRDLERRIAKLEKLVRAKRVKANPKQKRELEVGWSFGVSGDIAEDNLSDIMYNDPRGEDIVLWSKRGLIDSEGNITEKGWDQLVLDMRLAEDGCMRWLKSTFINAVEYGHDRYGDLVGRVWIDPENPNHIKEMSGEFDRDGTSSLTMSSGSLDWSILEAASGFGQSLLNASLHFHAEGLEDVLDR